MKVIVLHGPNLNMLGQREPDIYGTETLSQIDQMITENAQKLGIEVEIIQSNHEGELVEAIQRAGKRAEGIIINPAAYTHTSVAIRDALAAVDLPAIEVHLTNVEAREEFRRRSLTAPVCRGQICGLGGMSYVLALTALYHIIKGEAS